MNFNVKSRTTRFDTIFSDYARKDDLLNYCKFTHIIKTNPVDAGGNKITFLGEPTKDNVAVSRMFFNKRISTATKNI